MSHTDPEVLDWFNQAFKAISPYWKGKVVGTGLTYQEQRLLMTYLHGVEANERDFRSKTELFFHEILTKVPPQGLKLEIGLSQDNDAPLTEENFPINVQHYVIYRHAIGHPNVAPSKDEAYRSPIKYFYIVDPDKVDDTGLRLNDLEDKAISCYFKYKDDEIKVDQILTMLGVNIKKMSPADKILKFKLFSKKGEGKNDVEQQLEFQRFIDICEDQDLMLKYLIQEMIGAQVLERAGTTILVKESGEILGHTGKEAVTFLKNPKNSRVYNILKAHYETVVKRGNKLPDPVETGDENTVDAIMPVKARPKTKDKE
jgi:hypothetical protein